MTIDLSKTAESLDAHINQLKEFVDTKGVVSLVSFGFTVDGQVFEVCTAQNTPPPDVLYALSIASTRLVFQGLQQYKPTK